MKDQPERGEDPAGFLGERGRGWTNPEYPEAKKQLAFMKAQCLTQQLTSSPHRPGLEVISL